MSDPEPGDSSGGDPHDTDVAFDDWSGLFPERVETDRLVLRRLSRETVDLHAFYDVCAHDEDIDEVTEYLTWDPHPHPESTREFVAAMEDAWDDGEVATYLVEPKGTARGAWTTSIGEGSEPQDDASGPQHDASGPQHDASNPRDGANTFAGGCGLTLDWERRTGTLGLWLRKRFWGRGYSGERAAALIRLAFEHLDLDLVAVAHEAGNENSRRAILKYVQHFGGRDEAHLRAAGVNDGEPVDHLRYTISRAEYEDGVG